MNRKYISIKTRNKVIQRAKEHCEYNVMIRKTNDQPLKEVLDQWLKTYKHKSKLNQTRVAATWHTMMGPTISTYTRSIYIRKNTLFIYIEAASLRQELSYAKNKIKRNLNKKLGEEIIHKVVIH